MLSGCSGARPAGADGDQLACCGLISYSTEHTVTGTIGQRVPVTWSTGTGYVTLHQVKWEAISVGEGITGTKLMMEVTFEATTGTVKYGRWSWLESDSIGRADVVQTSLITDRSLHELPDAATLQAGQKDRGWAAFLIVDPPTPPTEIFPPGAVWTQSETDATGVFVTADGALMHAVQSPTNQTWIIDEAQSCKT